MNIEIKNLDNLTEDEKETFNRLVEKANKKSKVFKPEIKQPYYYITYCGFVFDDTWDNTKRERNMPNIGNCFETKEQAEFAVVKQKVYTELKHYALEHNESEIDWRNNSQGKWFINFNFEHNRLYVSYNTTWKMINDVYFISEEIAQNAIKEIGEDRIKKYLFEVEE